MKFDARRFLLNPVSQYVLLLEAIFLEKTSEGEYLRGTGLLFYHLRAEKLLGFYQAVFFWEGTFDGRTPMQCLNVEKTPPGFIPWDFLLFSTPQNFDGIFFQQLDVCLDIFPGWNFPWSFP